MAATTPTLDSLRPVASSNRPPAGPSIPALAPHRPIQSLPALAVCCALAAGLLGASNPDKSSVERHQAAPEIKHVETGEPTRWHADIVDVTLDPSLDDLGPDTREAVRQAFGAWIETDARLPGVRFNDAKSKRNKAKQDGVNRVIAAPITVAGHENDLAITVSYISETGAILESDIIINTSHAYTGPSTQTCIHSYDLQSVVTHEAGHFFGLGEDYDDPETTMYFRTSQCETKKRSLTEPDWSTVSYLYDQDSQSAEVIATQCSTSAPVPVLPSYAWLFSGLLALGLFRRSLNGTLNRHAAGSRQHAESARHPRTRRSEP